MSDEQHSIKRRIKQNKLRRKARRGEILMRRTYKLLKFSLVILMFYGIYRVANFHYWYLPRNTFTTGKNIEILGNSIVSKQKIFNEVKKVPPEYKQLYKINPENIAKAVEKLPPIKRAYVRRYIFPARLTIFVEEVIPAIKISPSNETQEVAAYSFDGEFINRDYLPLNPKSPAVKVLSFGTKEDDYEKWDKEKVNNLYKLAKQIEHYSGEKVEYLDLRIPNNAFVQLQTVKIRLGVLDYNVFERIKAISSMMSSEDVKRLSSNTKYIDLSWSHVQYVNIEKEDKAEKSEQEEKEENTITEPEQ